jgi:peptidyl-dipeptidase A
MNKSHAILPVAILCVPLFIGSGVAHALPETKTPAEGSEPTVAEAEQFIAQTEKELADFNTKASRASWVNLTYITDDTNAIAADYFERFIAYETELARKVKRFDILKLPPMLERKFLLLKLQLFSLSDPKERAEVAQISTSLLSDYGKGKYCPKAGKYAGKCLAISEVEQVLAKSRDAEELKEIWTGWHAIGAPMRQRYVRLIELQNKGARELGYEDMGAFWRSGYDMPPEQFFAEVERLWNHVRPLYEALHAYVRTRLLKRYGQQAVSKDGLIRADLLGNPWAQEWGNIFDLVVSEDSRGTGYDLTQILKEKNVDELAMVHYGESFFKSLGLAPLPQSFWERSMFVRPRDREVVCHASAWDIDNQDDLRLKMCILIRDEDFVTIHHELGHNFYQRAYKNQPFLFQSGANGGFHEAIGDTIALSITPEYLKQIGLLDNVPQSDDTALLLRKALDKVAFLPFGLLIDEWRWKVFGGEIRPADYNKSWWEWRARYQGVVPPAARTEADFDPGAKMHVAASVPYMNYFLADILQFQFFRAMCREAGYTGPLHRCSFYGNKAAGAKFNAMLEMGQSKPWPEALKTLTGKSEMDAGAILEYFAPLKKWLHEQNAVAGAQPGWTLPAKSQAAAR